LITSLLPAFAFLSLTGTCRCSSPGGLRIEQLRGSVSGRLQRPFGQPAWSSGPDHLGPLSQPVLETINNTRIFLGRHGLGQPDRQHAYGSPRSTAAKQYTSSTASKQHMSSTPSTAGRQYTSNRSALGSARKLLQEGSGYTAWSNARVITPGTAKTPANKQSFTDTASGWGGDAEATTSSTFSGINRYTQYIQHIQSS
jgi:hypothetical protein